MGNFLNPQAYKLILASQSPRRKALLESLGYQFEQRIKEFEESYPENLSAEEVPEFLSIKKAKAHLAELKENELLITSDTVVILEDQILEKAANAEEAKQMLNALSGNTHQVVSGVCLSSQKKQKSFSVSTTVFFKPLKEVEIDYYIKHYQPFDKAGAYGIQEWIGQIGVEKIEGSFYNVMGLPVKELFEAIQKF
ncbi:MAG: Maf family nucleotide pyrophosphatase [Vicingaceae bacterium]